MGQLSKNEREAEPIPGSPISQEEDKLKQNSHINWSATNPAVVTRSRKLHQNKLGTNTVGNEKKRKESRQKEAGVEVACREHHRQGGIQEGKNQGTKTKQTRATTCNMRRARKATIYIYKWRKTAQIGRQSKGKDNGIK